MPNRDNRDNPIKGKKQSTFDMFDINVRKAQGDVKEVFDSAKVQLRSFGDSFRKTMDVSRSQVQSLFDYSTSASERSANRISQNYKQSFDSIVSYSGSSFDSMFSNGVKSIDRTISHMRNSYSAMFKDLSSMHGRAMDQMTSREKKFSQSRDLRAGFSKTPESSRNPNVASGSRKEENPAYIDTLKDISNSIGDKNKNKDDYGSFKLISTKYFDAQYINTTEFRAYNTTFNGSQFKGVVVDKLDVDKTNLGEIFKNSDRSDNSDDKKKGSLIDSFLNKDYDKFKKGIRDGVISSGIVSVISPILGSISSGLSSYFTTYESSFNNIAARMDTYRDDTHKNMVSAVEGIAKSNRTNAVNVSKDLMPALSKVAEQGFTGDKAISKAISDATDKKIMPWLDTSSEAWINISANMNDSYIEMLKSQQLQLQSTKEGNRLLQSGIINSMTSEMEPLLRNIDYNTVDMNKLKDNNAELYAVMQSFMSEGYSENDAYNVAKDIISAQKNEYGAITSNNLTQQLFGIASAEGKDAFGMIDYWNQTIGKTMANQDSNLGVSAVASLTGSQNMMGGAFTTANARAASSAIDNKEKFMIDADPNLYNKRVDNSKEFVTATESADNKFQNSTIDKFDWVSTIPYAGNWFSDVISSIKGVALVNGISNGISAIKDWRKLRSEGKTSGNSAADKLLDWWKNKKANANTKNTSKATSKLTDSIKNLWNKAKNSKAGNGISNVAQKAKSAGSNLLSKGKDFLSNSKSFQKLSDFFTGNKYFSKISSLGKNLFSKIGNLGKGLFGKIGNLFKGGGSGIVSKLTGSLGKIFGSGGKLGAIATKMTGSVGSLSKLLSKGGPLLAGVAGVIKGVSDAKKGVAKANEWFKEENKGKSATTGQKVAAGAGAFIGGAGPGLFDKGSGWDKAKNIGGNTLKGAGIGAAIGSIIPGIGTAIGGAVGAGIGAITGAIGGEKIAKGFNALGKGAKFVFDNFMPLGVVIKGFRGTITESTEALKRANDKQREVLKQEQDARKEEIKTRKDEFKKLDTVEAKRNKLVELGYATQEEVRTMSLKATDKFFNKLNKAAEKANKKRQKEEDKVFKEASKRTEKEMQKVTKDNQKAILADLKKESDPEKLKKKLIDLGVDDKKADKIANSGSLTRSSKIEKTLNHKGWFKDKTLLDELSAKDLNDYASGHNINNYKKTKTEDEIAKSNEQLASLRGQIKELEEMNKSGKLSSAKVSENERKIKELEAQAQKIESAAVTRYAAGISNLASDQLIFAHKGERIISRKQNEKWTDNVSKVTNLGQIIDTFNDRVQKIIGLNTPKPSKSDEDRSNDKTNSDIIEAFNKGVDRIVNAVNESRLAASTANSLTGIGAMREISQNVKSGITDLKTRMSNTRMI